MSYSKTVASGERHTISDNGVKLFILNDLNEDLSVIKTDDDAFLTQEERHNHQISDFLLHSSQYAWLAELKKNEVDFNKACDQISSALDEIQSSRHESLLSNKLIRAIVVSHKTPTPKIISRQAKAVCMKLQRRSSVKEKPKNIEDYLIRVRYHKNPIGKSSQDGSTVDNAPNYPLHIKAYYE